MVKWDIHIAFKRSILLPARFVFTHWGRDKNFRYFEEEILKCIFLYENVWISRKISLKFVPKVQMNNIPEWFR